MPVRLAEAAILKLRKMYRALHAEVSRCIVRVPDLARTEFDMKGHGMSTLTLVHVVLSLIGIFSGVVVVFGLLSSKRLDGWTALFLITTVLTSVTGFLFPIHHLTPGLVVGVISLVMLAVAILARYALHLAGAWRKTYVVTAVIALYLNVFVLIAQAFMKVPALKAMAPTQSEPPFLVTQLVAMALFIVLAIFAAIKFRNDSAVAA
jgi:hypothetical protein